MMRTVHQLVIDPRFPVPYYTYVLQGFIGRGLVLNFRRLDCPVSPPFLQGMAFEYRSSTELLRGFVSTGDRSDIDEQVAEWADVYGKVNLDPACQDQRIMPLGPIFGIRLCLGFRLTSWR